MTQLTNLLILSFSEPPYRRT